MTHDLDAIARLLEKATPGIYTVVPAWDDMWQVLAPGCEFNIATFDKKEDADTFVALKNAAPELLAAARERDTLRAELAKFRKPMRAMKMCTRHEGIPFSMMLQTTTYISEYCPHCEKEKDYASL